MTLESETQARLKRHIEHLQNELAHQTAAARSAERRCRNAGLEEAAMHLDGMGDAILSAGWCAKRLRALKDKQP